MEWESQRGVGRDSQKHVEGDSEDAEKKEKKENEIFGELAIGRNRKERKREEDEGEESEIRKKGGSGVEGEDIGEGNPR
jgi:hypothetical protein